MNNVSQFAVRSLCFFDVFTYPLTAEELYVFGAAPTASYADFKMALLAQPPTGVEEHNGFYFLPGRAETAASRLQRVRVVDQKIARARRAARWIRSVPFVRAIFVCNSVAFGTATETSDIDFFIVAAPRRLWLVRFFTNFILKITGQRVGGFHSASKVCLSFYADSEHLGLKPVRISGPDIYLAHWLCTLLPLYDPENFFVKIISANEWMAELLPEAWRQFRKIPSNPPTARSRWQTAWEAMWRGSYGDLLESDAKKIQMSMLTPALKDAAKKGDGAVVISDGMLKFHEQDKRAMVQAAWLERCKHYAL